MPASSSGKLIPKAALTANLPMGFGPEDLGESSPAGASGDDAVKGADDGHEHGAGDHGCACGCGEHDGGNQ